MASESQTVVMQFDDAEQQQHAAEMGMWVFLETEILFFGVLFASYIIMRMYFPEGFAEGSRESHLLLGSINTGLLIVSTLTMALAGRSAKLGEQKALIGWLLFTALLGIAFLFVKGYEYSREIEEKLLPGIAWQHSGPRADQIELFYFMYWTMTFLHAIHLFIGVCAVSVMAWLAKRGYFSSEYATPVELTGLYWHFVDSVWVMLYPLIYLIGRAS
jgi:cytochrome c oxidase subunit III